MSAIQKGHRVLMIGLGLVCFALIGLPIIGGLINQYRHEAKIAARGEALVLKTRDWERDCADYATLKAEIRRAIAKKLMWCEEYVDRFPLAASDIAK